MNISTKPNKTILITGGAGFIGSHLIRLFVNKYPHYKIINLDKLTYAGNLANLKDIEDKPNYLFIKGDICDESLIATSYFIMFPQMRYMELWNLMTLCLQKKPPTTLTAPIQLPRQHQTIS